MVYDFKRNTRDIFFPLWVSFEEANNAKQKLLNLFEFNNAVVILLVGIEIIRSWETSAHYYDGEICSYNRMVVRKEEKILAGVINKKSLDSKVQFVPLEKNTNLLAKRIDVLTSVLPEERLLVAINYYSELAKDLSHQFSCVLSVYCKDGVRLTRATLKGVHLSKLQLMPDNQTLVGLSTSDEGALYFINSSSLKTKIVSLNNAVNDAVIDFEVLPRGDISLLHALSAVDEEENVSSVNNIFTYQFECDKIVRTCVNHPTAFNLKKALLFFLATAHADDIARLIVQYIDITKAADISAPTYFDLNLSNRPSVLLGEADQQKLFLHRMSHSRFSARTPNAAPAAVNSTLNPNAEVFVPKFQRMG